MGHEESTERIERLLDEHEIRSLMYRYARGVDRGDAEAIASVFHADGTDHHGRYDGPAAEFAQGVVDRGNAVKVPGNHHITNMCVEIDGETARAETYFLAFHPHLDSGVQVSMGIISGRYLDALERRDGTWGIVRRHVVTDWCRQHMSGAPWLRTTPEYGGYVRGARGHADASFAHLAGAPESDWYQQGE